MKPRDYLDRVVKPLAGRFLAESDALDLLFGALVATYHIVDYFAQEAGQKPPDVRKKLIAEFPEFDVVYSVALAQKHVLVENPKAHKGMKITDIKDPANSLLTLGGRPLVIGGKPLIMKVEFRVLLPQGYVDLKRLLADCVAYLDANIENLEEYFLPTP